MRKTYVLPVAMILAFAWSQACGEEPIGEIPDRDFDRLLSEIKPQRGESPWREVPWLTNVTEARQKAIAEDKPIAILTAADGSPLSRT